MKDRLYSDIRPSPIAGTWYPGDPDELTREVENYLHTAPAPAVDGEVLGFVVPHAGLIYSGFTAAHAFKALEGKSCCRVIIISPSHQRYSQPLLTSAHEAYATPLGAIPVDKHSLTMLNEALESDRLTLSPMRADREHSLEIELPFLQVLLPKGFELVPIMMPDQNLRTVNALSNALLSLYENLPDPHETLMVASSDLSHFYTENQAAHLDQAVLEAMQTIDPIVLYRLAASGGGEACGLGPIATVILTSKKLGANKLTITDYRTSAAVTKDRSSVVGYASAILTKPA